MRRMSLYKYFSERKWAEAFIKGEVLFRSLSYFRDYEDHDVREDQNEGASIFRPEGGLVISNLTQGTTFTLPGHALESSARQEEIFAFCVSRSLTDELRERFNAVAYVEILNIGAFCDRIEVALLPFKATFPGCPIRRVESFDGEIGALPARRRQCNAPWNVRSVQFFDDGQPVYGSNAARKRKEDWLDSSIQ